MSATDGSVAWSQRSSRELVGFLLDPKSDEYHREIITVLQVRLREEMLGRDTYGNDSVLLELFLAFLNRLNKRLDRIEGLARSAKDAAQAGDMSWDH